MILHSRQLAIKYRALASTGIIHAEPGSTNTVPGQVQFSLDIRAAEDDVLMKMEEQLKAHFERIAKGSPAMGLSDECFLGRPCTVKWTLDAPSKATKFDSGCIECVRQSAEDLLGAESKDLVQDIISGAGKLTFE